MLNWKKKFKPMNVIINNYCGGAGASSIVDETMFPFYFLREVRIFKSDNGLEDLPPDVYARVRFIGGAVMLPHTELELPMPSAGVEFAGMGQGGMTSDIRENGEEFTLRNETDKIKAISKEFVIDVTKSSYSDWVEHWDKIDITLPS